MKLFFLALVLASPLCGAKNREASELIDACMAGLTDTNYRTVTIFRTDLRLKRVRALSSSKSVVLLSDRQNANGSHILIVRPISKQSLRSLRQEPLVVNQDELVKVFLNKWDYQVYRSSRESIGSARARLVTEISSPTLPDIRPDQLRTGTLLRMVTPEDEQVDLLVVERSAGDGLYKVLALNDQARVGQTGYRSYLLKVSQGRLLFNGQERGDRFFHIGEANFHTRGDATKIVAWRPNYIGGPNPTPERALVLSDLRISK